MVLVGNIITANDVVADPRYSHLKPDQVTTVLLSQFTLEQKVKFDGDALKLINSIKTEYGTGVSCLIRIYNASGRTLNFQQQGPNWHGHMYKYPPDDAIENGQWSVFLHVKTAGAATGAQSCVIYAIDQEGDDAFLGWEVPWNQSADSSTIYTEVKASGTWPKKESWDSMQTKINNSGQHSSNSTAGKTAAFKSEASIGDDSSPQANYTLSADK